MARMYPEKLPPDPKRSAAEVKVFNKFKQELDDKFAVIYSLPWLKISSYGDEQDGECDFIVAHPEYGFIAIEVKGGGIQYDRDERRWTSRDRDGTLNRIKDPVQQARNSKYKILEEYQQHERGNRKKILMRHGVIFPDSKDPKKDLGPDKPQYLFCFLEEFDNNIRQWIMNRFTEHSPDDYRVQPLGEPGVQLLIDILQKSFQLDESLAKNLKDDDIIINRLTEDQCRYLKKIVHANKKVAISGSAGTGKTILAMQEARESLIAGERVLFTCYNKALSLYVERKLGKDERLKVATYSGFCESMIKDANIPTDDTIPLNDRFYEEYPKLLPEALKKFPGIRYDTILIDEGQDFRFGMLKSLESALDPQGQGKIRFFYDNNQDVYHNLSDDIEKFFPTHYPLVVNLRNSKKIYSLTQSFIKGTDTEAWGPDGEDIVWITAEDDDAIKTELKKYLDQLVTKEKISPHNIAILIPHQADKEKFVSNNRLGTFQIQSANDTENSITLDSVRRFKGLERSVILVVVNEEMIENKEMLYTALSRPRSLLALIGKKESLGKISAKHSDTSKILVN